MLVFWASLHYLVEFTFQQKKFLSGVICGDYCIREDEICICGNQTYTKREMTTKYVYCCSSPGSCDFEESDQGTDLICKNGTFKSVDLKCHDTCPYAEGKLF